MKRNVDSGARETKFGISGTIGQSIIRNLVTLPIGKDPERDDLARRIWTNKEDKDEAEEEIGNNAPTKLTMMDLKTMFKKAGLDLKL